MGLISKVIIALGILAAIGAVVIALSGTAKGALFVLMWDERSPLVCGGNFVMNIRHKNIEMSGGPVFEAGGDCVLRIIDSKITAGTVLSAGGGANITFEGGQIEGRPTAMSLGGDAKVLVKETQVKGRIDSGGRASVAGLPANDPRMQAKLAEQKQKAADELAAPVCEGLVRCYDKSGAYGQISGRVTAEVSADGTIAKAEYSNGQAPQAVRDCLTQTVRTRKLAAAKPGRVICEYGGTYLSRSQIMSYDARFEPKN